MTDICVSKLTIIGSNNGLSHGRRQAIIWTNARVLFIVPLGTNFSEILTKLLTFSFKKMRLKVSSAKWWPFCLGLMVQVCLNKMGHYWFRYWSGISLALINSEQLAISLSNLAYCQLHQNLGKFELNLWIFLSRKCISISLKSPKWLFVQETWTNWQFKMCFLKRKSSSQCV